MPENFQSITINLIMKLAISCRLCDGMNEYFFILFGKTSRKTNGAQSKMFLVLKSRSIVCFYIEFV